MSRRLDMLFYITVCIGMAVSTTSFTILSAMSETVSGAWFVGSIVAAGLLCVLIARMVGELCGAFPGAPGIRVYVLKGLGNRASLFTVLLYIILIVIFGSVECYMFALVVREALPTFPAPVLVLTMIVIVCAVNVRGLEMPRNVQILTTLVLLIAVFGLGIAGLALPPPVAPLPAQTPQFQDALPLFATSIGFALFLFVGFEWVVPFGRDATAFQRQIPQAMQLSVLINIVVYTVFALGVMHHVSQKDIVAGLHPQVLLSRSIMGDAGPLVALVMSALAIISTFNAGVMGGARLLYSLSREGHLPKVFSRVSLTTGAPYAAIIALAITVACVSMLVILWQLEIVFAVTSSTIICIVYSILLLCLIRLRADGRTRFRYDGKLPNILKRLTLALVSVFGVLSMFSIPSVWIYVTTGVFVCLLTAGIGAYLITTRLPSPVRQ